MHSTLRRACGAFLAAAFLLAACGDDDATTTSDTSTPAATAPDADTADDDGTAADDVADHEHDHGDEGDDHDHGDATGGDDVDAEAADQVIEITVVDGVSSAGGHEEVVLGSVVLLRVTSDAADEVHVHGYDLLAEMAAGETVEIQFTADIPGVFEVELEGARIPLVELAVS